MKSFGRWFIILLPMFLFICVYSKRPLFDTEEPRNPSDDADNEEKAKADALAVRKATKRARGTAAAAAEEPAEDPEAAAAEEPAEDPEVAALAETKAAAKRAKQAAAAEKQEDPAPAQGCCCFLGVSFKAAVVRQNKWFSDEPLLTP